MIKKIGLVGLGKMGYNLALNVKSKGFQVVAFDVNSQNMELAAKEGIVSANSLEQLSENLPGHKVLWVMVPSGEATEEVLQKLSSILNAGDIVIDGGNSNFKDSIRRYHFLKSKRIHFLDCGTSGGINGARNGACTMVGGDKEIFEICEHLFRSISVENGYYYVGEAGSGHFVKMVHNGVEYGMMQAMAEGFELLNKSSFDIDFQWVAKVWNHGSVIRSWLMELMENAFSKDACLSTIKGVMHSSGEGKWTVETALEMGVPTPVIALSMMMRYRSQESDTFAGKVVAALRNEFGGHAVEKAKP